MAKTSLGQPMDSGMAQPSSSRSRRHIFTCCPPVDDRCPLLHSAASLGMSNMIEVLVPEGQRVPHWARLSPGGCRRSSNERYSQQAPWPDSGVVNSSTRMLVSPLTMGCLQDTMEAQKRRPRYTMLMPMPTASIVMIVLHRHKVLYLPRHEFISIV